MPNLIDVVIALSEIFERLQTRYAVGGALANNYWGILRTTEDVDCLISLPAIKYQLFADEFNAIGCKIHHEGEQDIAVSVSSLHEHVQNRKLIELHSPLLDPPVRIELFIPVVPLQDEVLRRAVTVRVRGRDVPITTAEDLILLKLVFHRPKDLQDVRGILYVQRGKLDLDYMRHWSARSHEPDVQQELDRLIAEYATK
jgi:predicted nucleotidyltransferase